MWLVGERAPCKAHEQSTIVWPPVGLCNDGTRDLLGHFRSPLWPWLSPIERPKSLSLKNMFHHNFYRFSFVRSSHPSAVAIGPHPSGFIILTGGHNLLLCSISLCVTVTIRFRWWGCGTQPWKGDRAGLTRCRKGGRRGGGERQWDESGNRRRTHNFTNANQVIFAGFMACGFIWWAAAATSEQATQQWNFHFETI